MTLLSPKALALLRLASGVLALGAVGPALVVVAGIVRTSGNWARSRVAAMP